MRRGTHALVVVALLAAATATSVLSVAAPAGASLSPPPIADAVSLATTSSYTVARSGDLNGDGRADLVLGGNASTVSVYLSAGAGARPAAHYEVALPGTVSSFELARMDAGPTLDIVAARANAVFVMPGRGDGTFGAAVTTSCACTTGSNTRLALADINGDGRLDAVLTRALGLTVLPGNGDGTFGGPSAQLATAADPVSLVATDLSGDGVPDLAALFQVSGSAPTVRVYLGVGDGTLAAPVDTPTIPASSELAAADITGDGKPDLVVLAGTSGQVKLAYLAGTGGGSFAASLSIPFTAPALSGGANGLVVRDIDGDGKLDLVVDNSGVSVLAVAYGTGGGSFGPVQVNRYGSTNTSTLGGVAAFDANNDGTVDLIIPAAATKTSVIFTGEGSRRLAGMYQSTAWSSSVALLTSGDLAGDGHTDLVTTETAFPPAVSLWRHDGANGVTRYQSVITNNSETVAGGVVARLNGDNSPDVAVVTYRGSVGHVQVMLGNGDGTMGPPTSYAAGGTPGAVVAADVNSDGKMDLIASDTTSGAIDVLLGNGDGTFGPATAFPAGSHAYSVAVGDFNHDGHLDLAVSNYYVGVNTVTLLFGDGAGNFPLPHPTIATLSPASAVRSGDFNGDGNTDLLILSGPSSNQYAQLALGNGAGGFGPLSTIYNLGSSSGTSVPTPQVIDLNGDGRLDLVLNGDAWLGNGDGTFTKATMAANVIGGSTVADIDGDGHLDLFAAGGAAVWWGAGVVPTITAQPASTTVQSGQPVTFTAAATGQVLSLHWQVSIDGGATFSDISGANGSSYSFTPQGTDDQKQFRLGATDSQTGLTAFSSAATLTVLYPAIVTTQPASASAQVGFTATFSAAARANPAASVQWQVSADEGSTWSDIAGATGLSYTRTALITDNDSQYRAVFTNSQGSTATTAATLTVPNTASAAAITVVSGYGQSAVVNHTYAQPLQVKVTDAAGRPLAGVSVTFGTPSPGAGIVTAAPVQTAANGVASLTPHANFVAGTFNVTASTPGVADPANFVLQSVPEAPVKLVPVGTAQSVTTVGQPFASPVAWTVEDTWGNPVPGTSVNVHLVGGPASATLGASTTTADGNGVASFTATANGIAGAYAVVAALPPSSTTLGTWWLANTVAPGMPVPGTPVWGVGYAASGLTFIGPPSTVATDSVGSSYVLATWQSCAPFSSCGYDSVVSSYDVAGTLRWTKRLAPTGAVDLPSGLAVDDNQNVFVGGSAGSGITGITGSGDLFMVALTSNGDLRWARRFGNSSGDTAGRLAADGNGSVVMTGSTTGTLPGSVVPGNGTPEAFAAVFDILGNQTLVTQAGTDDSGTVTPSSVAFDRFGNITVAGSVTGHLAGSGPAIGASDAFVQSWDPFGNVRWRQQFGSDQTDGAQAVTVDDSGAVFVAGSTLGTIAGAPESGSTQGYAAGFVAAYDASGTRQWIHLFGSSQLPGDPTGVGVRSIVRTGAAVDVIGTVTGTLPGSVESGFGSVDGFAASWDTSGNARWVHEFGSAGNDSLADSGVDGAGRLHTGGSAGGTLYAPTQVSAGAFIGVWDFEPPTVAVSGLSAGDSFVAGQAVTVSYTCADISGVAACSGSPASGGSLDTTTPGPHTFAVVAIDSWGNAQTTTVAYTVTARTDVNVLVSGDNQTAVVGTGFGQPFTITVEDLSGQPISGVPVALSPPSGDVSMDLSATSGVTDGNGQVTVTGTARHGTGTYDIGVTAGGDPATITATNAPGAPVSMYDTGGATQEAPVGTTYYAPLTVVVLDAYGNPVPGVPVTFTPPQSGASVSMLPGTVITDDTGHAAAFAVANTVAGVVSVTVTAAGLTWSIPITNLALTTGIRVRVASGGGQSAVTGQAFPSPLVFEVDDVYGNGVPDVNIGVTAPASGATGTMLPASGITDQNGQFAVSATAGPVPGLYLVTATAVGTPSPVSTYLGNSAGAGARPPGQPDWLHEQPTFITPYHSTQGVAVDPSGNMVIAEDTRQNVPGPPEVLAGQYQGSTVTALNSDGSFRWGHLLSSSTGTVSSDAVTTDRQGNVYWAVSTAGAVDALGVPASAGGFIVSYDPAGNLRWVRTGYHLPSTPQSRQVALAVDGAGDLTVMAPNCGVALGIGDTSCTNQWAVVTSYEPSGHTIWSTTLQAGTDTAGTSLAVGPAGQVAVVGVTNGTLPGSLHPNAGGWDGFVAVFDAFGRSTWVDQMDGVAMNSVAIDGAGNALVGGGTSSTVPGASEGNAGGLDAFVAAWAPDGTRRWAHQFGGPGSDVVTTVAVGPSGDLVATGTTNGTTSITTEPANGGSDVLLGSWDPTGALRWGHQFGSTGNDTPIGLGVDPTGHVVVGGGAAGTIAGSDTPVGPFANGYDAAFIGRWNLEGPTIAIDAPAAGATVTTGQPVAAAYGCADPAGVASCVGPVAPGQLIDTTTPGPHTFTVTALGAEGVTRTATATYTVAAATERVTLTNAGQSATVAEDFARPLVATVVGADGQPVAGVTVSFAVGGGPAGATLSNPTAVTDASGQASVTAHANTRSGSYPITVTADSASATATFTNLAGPPAAMYRSGGSFQEATVTTPFDHPVAAQVLDSFGNPVSGVAVGFTSPSGAGARIVSPIVFTDASGVAATPVQANIRSGPYELTASSGGLQVTVPLTNLPGAAAQVVVSAGSSQSAAPGQPFTQPLVAQVQDQYANPVAGAAVAFSLAGSPGGVTITPGSGTSDANGLASASVTAGMSPGRYGITAALVPGSASSARFVLTVTPPVGVAGASALWLHQLGPSVTAGAFARDSFANYYLLVQSGGTTNLAWYGYDGHLFGQRPVGAATALGAAPDGTIYVGSGATITAYAPFFGDQLWQASLASGWTASAIAAAPSGDVVVAGTNSTGPTPTAEVAAFTSGGVPKWTRGIGGAGLSSITTDPSGRIYVAGWSYPYSPGYHPPSTTDGQVGGSALVSAIDPAGAIVWTHLLDSGNSATTNKGLAIAVDGAANVYVAGTTTGHVISGTQSAGGTDAFVASWSTVGLYRWVNQFGGPGTDLLTGIAVAPGSPGIAVTGSTTASIPGASEPLLGGTDVLLSGLSTTGDLQWTHLLGTLGADAATGLTYSDNGHPVVAGTTAATMPDSLDQNTGTGTNAFVGQLNAVVPLVVGDAGSAASPISVPFQTATPIPAQAAVSGSGAVVTGVTQGSHGSVVLDPELGNVVYAPAAGYEGPDLFTFSATDDDGQIATGTAYVDVASPATPAPPDAPDRAASVTGPNALTVAAPGLLAGAGGVGTTLSATGPAAHGTVVASPDGSYRYTPDLGFAGTDSFTYRVTDAYDQSASGTVQVTVTAPAGPVVPAVLITTAYQTGRSVAAPGVLSSVSGTGPLTVTANSTPGHGTASVGTDGSFTYTPAAGYSGDDSFTYTVIDPYGQSATGTVTVTVSAPPTPPTVSCSSADASWHGSNVTVACTTTAGTYPLANPADASFTLATTVPAGSETAASFTGTHAACDTQSSCVTAGPVGPFKVDRRAPVVTLSTPSAGTTYGLGTVVNATYSCADAGSGPGDCVGSVANGAAVDTTTAGLRSFTVTTHDAAGNAGSTTVTYTVAGATVAGLVTDPNAGGAPVAAVNVRLYLNGAANPTVTTTTGADGRYSFAGLVSGSWTLQFAKTGYLSVWYPNAAIRPNSVPLALVAPQAVTADTSFTRPSSLAGTLVDPNSGGVGVSGATVSLYPDGVATASATATTATDGSYSFPSVPPGRYQLKFTKGAITVWYQGAPTRAVATNIDLVSAQAYRANDQLAGPVQNALGGSVTNQGDGTPLAGATVTVYPSGSTAAFGTATTTAAGTWQLSGLPAGNYQVAYTAAGRVPVWYLNQPAQSTATPVAVSASGITTINQAMVALPATIGGTVTDGPAGGPPAAGVTVDLYVTGAASPTATTTTSATGSYSFGSLAAGSYQLAFTGGPTRVWYPASATQSGSTAVTATAGQTVTANAAIVTRLAGTVTRQSGGTAVAGARVTIYPTGSATASATATTAADGTWSVSTLASGSYQVRIDAVGFLTAWYLNATTQATSTPVTLGLGANATINQALADALLASITGTVTAAVGGAPLGGVNVRIWVAGAANYLVAGTTDASGHYLVSVTPGTYQLQFARPGNTTLWWQTASIRAGATPLVLPNGQSTTINVSLK